jgi:hypothetical protein
MRLLVAVVLVTLRVHEAVELGLVLDFQFDKPGGALGIGIDQLRLVGQDFVDFQDGSADGSVNIRRGLDRFHAAERIALVELVAHFWQVYKDNVPKRGLGKIGNPTRPNAVVAHRYVFVSCFVAVYY